MISASKYRRAVNKRPRSRTMNLTVNASQTGALVALPKFGLLAPITYAKTSGSANLTVDASGNIVAAAALGQNVTQSIVGTATGADGCVIKFTYNLTGFTLVITLNPLTLSATTVAENTGSGTFVATLLGRTSGSTLSLIDDAGGRFAISGGDLVVGSVLTNYETATSHSITVRETLAGATNTPLDTVLTINVTNVYEQPSLAALSLSSTTATTGTASTINIIGATAGSVITGSVPDGMTLNSAARTISGTPTTVGTYNFTLTETLGDSANSPRGTAVTITVSASTEFATTLTDTITYNGETFTLNKPTRVGYALNGRPFIVSDTADLTWVSSSTPSAVVNTYVAHGAEFDPWWMGAGRSQGVDEMWQYGASGTNELGASGSMTYDNTKNIHPARSGVAFPLTGKCGRIVQFIRRADYALGQFCIPSKIIQIDVVPTVPPAGAICAIYNGSGGVQWLTTANANKSIFRASGYVSGQTTYAAALSGNYLPDCDYPFFVDNGEVRRGGIIYSSLWPTGYSGDYGQYWSTMINACHAEGASGVSDTIMYRMMTIGALLIENVRRGNLQRGGAGQNTGLKPFAALVAMSANDATILSESRMYEGGETHQQFRATSSFLGVAAGFPNGSGAGYQNRRTILPDDVGRSVFFHGNQALPPLPTVDPDLYDTSAAVRYQYTAGPSANLGFSAILQFQNGPGGINGQQYVLQGGSNDPASNAYAAALTYWWEYSNASNDVSVNLAPFNQAWHRTLLQTVYANYVSAVAQPPAGFSPERNQSSYLNVTADGFTWDWRNCGHNTDAITQYDNRYTLDGGRSFLVENAVASNGTKTGMPAGVSIGVQFRRRSASGIGPWSVNYAKTSASGTSPSQRLVVSPTGTPAGTPANTQAPQILYRPYESWAGPYFENLAAPAAQNAVLYAGVGWWTGDLTGGYTYQWYAGSAADGSDKIAIAGATSDSFVVTSAQAGKYLTVGVTNGGVTAFSPTYIMAASSYPSMSLTQFDGTSDYLDKTTAFAGVTNGRKFTFSVTGLLTGADGVLKRVVAFGDAAGTASTDMLLQIDRITSNAIQVILRTTGGTTFFTGTTTANAWRTTDGEATFSVSFDLDAGRYQVCLNNTVIPWASAPTVTVQDIPWVSVIRPRLFVALTGAASVQFNHRCTFFHTDSLDLSVTANQNKLKPANIGNRGEGVFGVDALVMLYGPAASLGTNYGTGGNYTLAGTVEDV